MQIPFDKYHGTGNDFILVDNRSNIFPKQQKVIANCCHRKNGIGADGLILIENHLDYDFEMLYHNADGNMSSMCGNGGRCAAIFSHDLRLIRHTTRFMAFDGVHTAHINKDNSVKLSMVSVGEIELQDNAYIMNTGSPHYVALRDSLDKINVIEEGREIRYNDAYRENGINVNFVSIDSSGLNIRTYERGVEEETLSCGTGTVAAAIAASLKLNCRDQNQEYLVHALGGDIKVYFTKESSTFFNNIFIEGPAQKVFSGIINLESIMPLNED